MKEPIRSVIEEMTETQIDFICEELKIRKDLLLEASEDDLGEIYDILCDIESSETPTDDSPLSERCKIVSDIVTLWGNAIAEAEGYFEEDED